MIPPSHSVSQKYLKGGRVRQVKGEGEVLTAHGVQSHQAANEIVKVHVAVLIAIATDNQLVELVVQRETCTHKYRN